MGESKIPMIGKREKAPDNRASNLFLIHCRIAAHAGAIPQWQECFEELVIAGSPDEANAFLIEKHNKHDEYVFAIVEMRRTFILAEPERKGVIL